MPLRTAVVKTGATMAPTGGSDFTFADDGITIPNGVHLIVPAVADSRVRPAATVKYRPASQKADGSWIREKKSISFVIPIIQANGIVDYNVWRIERERNPEALDAAISDGNVMAAQMLTDSDFAGFWATGSLS